MTNVIDFTKARQMREEKSKEDEDYSEEEQIADFATSVVCETIEVMSSLGYDIRDNKKCLRDVFAAIEAIRGIMHRINEEEHPFHIVSDTMFQDITEALGKTEDELMHGFIENMELELD